MYNKDRSLNEFCQFCFHNHNCRTCPYENELKKDMTIKVGIIMEELVQNIVKCKYCNTHTLKRLGDNSPSLDLECTKCNKIIEVKSKCLSVNNLPNDIECKGGNYLHFCNNISIRNLDLVLILYGVNRSNKEINIREIYWIKNNLLKEQSNIKIIKNDKNNLSKIYIKDRLKLDKLIIKNIPKISFKAWAEKLIKTILI